MTQKVSLRPIDMGIGYGLLGMVIIIIAILTPACYLHSWMGKKK